MQLILRDFIHYPPLLAAQLNVNFLNNNTQSFVTKIINITKAYINLRYKQQRKTLKNCRAEQFSKTLSAVHFNLLQLFPSPPPFAFAVLFKPFFSILSSYFFTFRLSFWLPVYSRCIWLNFVTQLFISLVILSRTLSSQSINYSTRQYEGATGDLFLYLSFDAKCRLEVKRPLFLSAFACVTHD